MLINGLLLPLPSKVIFLASCLDPLNNLKCYIQPLARIGNLNKAINNYIKLVLFTTLDPKDIVAKAILLIYRQFQFCTFSMDFTCFRNSVLNYLPIWSGAPGCVNDSILTGMQFVDGFESFFFVSRWSMHQLVIYPRLLALMWDI